ncbi:MAG: folate-binding protein [Gallionella sp.]
MNRTDTMNTSWQDYLIQHGAKMDSGVAQDFGDRSAELDATANGTVLCDLNQFGVLRVSGEEAQTFLQSLLSNDIREVSKTSAQYSSLNTAKGRVLATMLIWQEGDDYLLQLPRELIATMHKKLSMYVLRAKVKISDASDEIVVLGLSGSTASEILQNHFGDLPQQSLTTFEFEQASVLRLDESRFQISTSPQHASKLWEALNEKAHPVGSPCWDWLNIRAGIATILPQTQEHFVAQMINLDLIGGINFNKGCYPGQEIVARTHYLGKLKRRMYLAHIDSNELPQPGAELYSADMENQASGVIANVSTAPGGGFDVLAVIQIASHDAYPVHLGSLLDAKLSFRSLPYPMP